MSPDPYVIFNPNPKTAETLIHDRARRVVVDVVHRGDNGVRRYTDEVSNLDSTVAKKHRVRVNRAAPTEADPTTVRGKDGAVVNLAAVAQLYRFSPRPLGIESRPPVESDVISEQHRVTGKADPCSSRGPSCFAYRVPAAA